MLQKLATKTALSKSFGIFSDFATALIAMAFAELIELNIIAGPMVDSAWSGF